MRRRLAPAVAGLVVVSLVAAFWWATSPSTEPTSRAPAPTPIATRGPPPARAPRPPPAPIPFAGETGGAPLEDEDRATVRCALDEPDQPVVLRAARVGYTPCAVSGAIFGGDLSLEVPLGEGHGSLRLPHAEYLVRWDVATPDPGACTVERVRSVGSIEGVVAGWDDRSRGRVLGCGGGAAVGEDGWFLLHAASGPCTIYVEEWLGGQVAEGPPAAVDVPVGAEVTVHLQRPDPEDARPLNQDELRLRAKAIEVARDMQERAGGGEDLVDRLGDDLDAARALAGPDEQEVE